MSDFVLKSSFSPTGDQPQAIEQLVNGIKKGYKFQTLHGVTGSGKTYTLANVIRQVNKPVLMMAHNKTLAAQLTSEYKEFFPDNAVEYFISYYDYYQPEAYLPSTDTYIEKDSSINDEIDRLRHKATYSLFNRSDVLIVSSVSCIYGLGSPEYYAQGSFCLAKGQMFPREKLLESLINARYERNDLNLTRGKFRVMGEVVEIFPAYDENILRVEFWGDEIENVLYIDPLNRSVKNKFDSFMIYPASHYVVPTVNVKDIVEKIKIELADRLKVFKAENKLLEAQRLEQRTMFDIEMMEEIGYCSGIENYSRILTGRNPGEPPYTLIDYFPKDFLLIVDESHVTLPQVRGMYAGDKSRKTVLVDYGFRLPSALDNRPLNFPEFEAKIPQVIFVSATPGPYETEHSIQVVEQIIRPTGLLDPAIEIRKTENQMQNLMEEIKKRVADKERTLVVTITKKMAEELAEYLLQHQLKTRYLHSDINTLDRYEILRDLRTGDFDVLVGINLLREGLDLPEVSLIAILDADKEGFLRDERSLIQIIGRAARNVKGTVLLYADKMTKSMEKAIYETNRRRKIQKEYNDAHGITPTNIYSKIKDNIREEGAKQKKDLNRVQKELEWLDQIKKEDMLPHELLTTTDMLRKQMHKAARDLEFEKAALIRDKISSLQGRDKTP
ncbi:MAG: excinuclease ABC subunit UvrB [Candidatus Margulisbacteria bacterium]|nr:excinuclease ABC subunit UvrB [Candidatus Margulisiibacteriota bacterium]